MSVCWIARDMLPSDGILLLTHCRLPPLHPQSQEDQLILRLVDHYGAKQWTLVAGHLQGRLGKQCRERWHNHLNPAIKHGNWTREEDEVVVRFHACHGNQVRTLW